MRWCALLGIVVLIFVWAGCGSGSKPTTITFAPTSMSLTPGEAQNITATVTDSGGNIIATQTVNYTTSNSAIADVSTDGLGQVCAGTWDSEATPRICNSATVCTSTTTPCTATITGSLTNGPSAKLNVVVHPRVGAVNVDIPAAPGTTCIPLNGTATFRAKVNSTDGSDITNLVFDSSVSPPVSPFLWTTSPSTLATLDTSGATCTVGNTCVVTAVATGTMTVVATLQSAPGSVSTQNISSQPVSITIPCP